MNNQIPIIPQNNKTNFIFKINELFVSTEILINWQEDINLENLYLIFQSFIFNKETIIKSIYLSATQGEEKINIFHNIKLKKMMHISYIDFIDWFEEIFANDERYLESFKYYAIGFTFEKESNHWKEKKIYPQYPWNEEFKKHFIAKYSIQNKLNKIKKQLDMSNKIIKKLQKENFILKKKKYKLHHAIFRNKTNR